MRAALQRVDERLGRSFRLRRKKGIDLSDPRFAVLGILLWLVYAGTGAAEAATSANALVSLAGD